MPATVRTMRRLVLVAVVAVLGSCGGDDAETPGRSASVDSTSTTADFSHLEKYEDYYGEGVVVQEEAFDIAGCMTADGEPAFYNGTVEECADGRTLLWSEDVGWGFVGEPWHTDVTQPPAEVLDTRTG